LHNISGTEYPPDDLIDRQIHASVGFSLHHLRHSGNPDDSYLNSLLLHYESIDDAQSPRALRTWEILSSYVPDQIRALGVSITNFQTPLYPRLHEMPSPFCTLAKFIQFRFAPETVTLRNHHRFEDDGCIFQLEDVLTQNRALLNGSIVADLAQAVGVRKEVALYLYVMGLPGVCVVIGTKNPTHMKEDFEGYEK
jgi:hypothetical protein